MTSTFSKRSRFLYIPVLFLIVFYLISYAYIKRDAGLDRKHFKTHALIIAVDTWALNRSGAQAYLQLAAKADHYKTLILSIPGDEEFLSIQHAPLTGISLVLSRAGLIGLRELSEEIRYNKQVIGQLYGQKYVRVIFPLLNILIALLLVLLTIIFIFYLFRNKNFLEQQVLERTRNLQESERRFHDLVDLLPEMVLETDRDGNIEYYNKAAKEQLMIALDANSQANFNQCISSEDREKAIRYFHDSFTNTAIGLQEFLALDPLQHTFPILLRSAPVRRDGVVIGARMIAIDITERHRLEEQLLRDQKMKAIGLMAGGVAHDLNNILSGIISYPELLLLDMGERDRMRKPLEAIRKAGLDAAEVVADLLTVARGVVAAREVIDPNTLIKDYLNSPDFLLLRARYPQITINTSLDEKLHHIFGSPIHIRKCLMNLFMNGMEAIPGKGTLSVSTHNLHQADSSDQKTQELPEGRYIKISVYDSGSGISPHEIEHIFEPFFTKKVMGRSGTGLGLAVVWNTMRDHGGVVNVISKPQQGTTFDLYFPSVEKKAQEATQVFDWRTLKGKGESVLVIDDEPRQRAIAKALLTSLNYQVDTVPSGEEAVKYLQRQCADILVIDMIMDPGQNGKITYEQILKIHPQQKALVASGFAENEDVKATLALGAGAFVSKPYTLEKIGTALYEVLHT